MICLICKARFNSHRSLGVHVKRTHHLNSKEYYDTYLKIDGEDICKVCGKQKPFKNINVGYSYFKYCSKKCAQNDPDLRKKLEETCLEKYGIKNGGGSKQSVVKIKKTKKKRYGNETYCNSKKIKSTIQERYGVDNIFQSEHFKEVMTEQKQKERNQKQRQSFERMGKWVSLKDKSAFALYERIVWKETRKHKKKLFEQWNGKDFYTGERLITNEEFKKKNPNKHINTNPLQPSIDHVIEVIKGFQQGIPPKEIGHINNLCICSKSSNTKKRWGKL